MTTKERLLKAPIRDGERRINKSLEYDIIRELDLLESIIEIGSPRLSLIKSMIKTNSVDYYEYNRTVYDYEIVSKETFDKVVELMVKILGENNE